MSATWERESAEVVGYDRWARPAGCVWVLVWQPAGRHAPGRWRFAWVRSEQQREE